MLTDNPLSKPEPDEIEPAGESGDMLQDLTQGIKVKNGISTPTVTPDGYAETLQRMGTDCANFLDGRIKDALAMTKSDDDAELETNCNANLAAIQAIGPRDAVESLLATQMVAIHQATIRHTRLLAYSGTLERMALDEKALNRLARTYAAQTETLNKYQTKGKQKITVKHRHVTVEEGEQAVIGDVNSAKGA